MYVCMRGNGIVYYDRSGSHNYPSLYERCAKCGGKYITTILSTYIHIYIHTLIHTSLGEQYLVAAVLRHDVHLGRHRRSRPIHLLQIHPVQKVGQVNFYWVRLR